MDRLTQTVKLIVFSTLLTIMVTVCLPVMSTAQASGVSACSRFGISCYVASGQAKKVAANCTTLNNCDLISKYVDPFINFLAALVGVAVVISIVVGGIQYSSSGGDPAKASAAKNRIRNAVIALITFILLYTLLNFLIPGGLVSG